MFEKKWFKKSVALLLAFCMTLGLMTQWGQLTSNADSGYTELTFSDFDIDDQVIAGGESTSTTVFGSNATVNANGLNKIAFTGYLTFAEDCTTISLLQFGNMMSFMPNNDKQFGALNIEANGWAGWTDDVGETIVGTKVKVRMEFDANGDDYVMKTYVNDIESGTITISNGVNSFTWRELCLTAEAGKTLSVESYKKTPEVVEPTEYSVITFNDFNLAKQTVPAGSMVNSVSAQVNSSTGLNGKAFVGYVTFPENCTSNATKLQFGNMLAVTPNADGTAIILINPNNNVEFGVTSTCSESMLGKKVKLRLEFYTASSDYIVNTYVDDAPLGKTTLTGGVTMFTWYDLCAVSGQNEQITIESYTEPQEPLVQKSPEELGYEQIGLPHFTMGDGVYAPGKVSSDHWYDVYQEGDSVSNKYLDVNVEFKGETLSSDGASIRYVSANGWEGISIAVEGDMLRIFNPSVGGGYDYTLEELGLISFDEAFNLKLGVVLGQEYETGEKDLTFCLWINNILIEKDAKLSKVKGVGNGMGIYTGKNALVLSTPDSVVVKDRGKLKQLPTDFRKVTFQSFEIEDGKYTYKPGELAAEGSWVLPMNKTFFSGDICFSSIVGGDFRYGGAQNAWCGLYFYTKGGVDGKSDGKLYMNLVAPEATDNPSGLVLEAPYVFKPYTAGMDLVDNWMNLKLTTEFVDSDKDGKTDDVKLGVWFNNVLYDNEYIYLKDFAKHLGNYAGISVSAENSHIQVKKDTTVYMGIDYSLFGFTDNWVKEFGL